MLTTFNEVDMTAVMELRARRKDAFKERHGVSLGFMSFFTKASIGALKAFPPSTPSCRATSWSSSTTTTSASPSASKKGWWCRSSATPTARASPRSRRRSASWPTKARDGKLALSELQGGTFTITNGGIFGSLLSTPILNAPQVGILGMHAIQKRPVVRNDEVVIRPMMYLALSYDHRIVDGREAVQFLVRIKELIEDPESLLIEG